MNTILISRLSFLTSQRVFPYMAEKLRGYFSTLYREQDLYHNHQEDGKDIYRYPLIQYKVLDGQFRIIGINQGAEFIRKDFLKHEEFTIGTHTYQILSSELEFKKEVFDLTDSFHRYRFKTIWAPLNSKNYKLYLSGKLDLNQALQNNLLSDLKGLGIRANKRIIVQNSHFIEQHFKHKNKSMIGFTGSFECNMEIPKWIGTGKWKSVGFGVIKNY